MVRTRSKFFYHLYRSTQVWKNLGFTLEYTTKGVIVKSPSTFKHRLLTWDELSFYWRQPTLAQGVVR